MGGLPFPTGPPVGGMGADPPPSRSAWTVQAMARNGASIGTQDMERHAMSETTNEDWKEEVLVLFCNDVKGIVIPEHQQTARQAMEDHEANSDFTAAILNVAMGEASIAQASDLQDAHRVWTVRRATRAERLGQEDREHEEDDSAHDARVGARDTFVPAPLAVPEFPIGTRVVIELPVDRYPNFVAEHGERGVVTQNSLECIAIRLDEPKVGAEEWNNEVQWNPSNADEGEEIENFRASVRREEDLRGVFPEANLEGAA